VTLSGISPGTMSLNTSKPLVWGSVIGVRLSFGLA
jgi:hypothetical protein